ncbi:hypothetical protein NHH03_00875 [Stieleria sp. TO1_6]|uniref:hypothetical protein n=1 Tax=Stieleria tagensis TaxID=2956795 RepID=UPI00209AAF63|nr:hypothetical protein [Stieleria tagensis]MCO8120269.1 hypothetical protein [Stieleria tagensis]
MLRIFSVLCLFLSVALVGCGSSGEVTNVRDGANQQDIDEYNRMLAEAEELAASGGESQ